jgi:DHA2 family multidrug resistance protein
MTAQNDLAVDRASAGRQRIPIMATVIMASALYSGDLSVVGVALPHMQGAFSATPDQISWVATAFVLGSSAMIVATGWLASRIGGKRLFLISMAGFMSLSVMAAQAGTLEEEVLWRLAMGALGAPILPLCQVILMNAYPREAHGRALAVWSVGTMVAPIIALPLAGIFIDLFGWQSVFFMNLPFGGLALMGAVAFVPTTQAEPRHRLDWFGLLMLVLIFGLMQFVLGRGARLGWFESTAIVAALAVAALCAYMLVVHLLTAHSPLIPPELFRNRNFFFGILGTFIFGATNMSIIIFLPLMQKNQLGFPIELVALIMAVRLMGSMMAQYTVSVLITRVDPRHLIAVASLTAATATWIMSGWSVDVSPWQVLWPAILHGMSGGSTWVCFNALTVSTLDTRLRPHGVPIYFLSFNIGFSFGIAAALTYWANSAQVNYARLAEYVTPFNKSMRAPFLPPGWDVADPATAATLAGEITRQAGMIAYNNTFVVAAIAALCIVPLVYMLNDPGWRRRD